MKKMIAILSLLFLGAAAFGQATAPATASASPAETLGQLSRSANEELAKSTRELSQLQKEIEAEKLPMSKKLSALEEQLAQLRVKQEEVTRQADNSNLDSTNIKTETKVLQDQIDYIATLLDGYGRTYDTKLNAPEVKVYMPAIEKAKEAYASKTATQAEKFAAQIDLFKVSIKRLNDVIGGARLEGEGADQQGVVAKGQFALIGPVSIFSNTTGSVAGIVLPKSDAANLSIRPLEGSLQTGLVALVTTGQGTLPLDPSRGAALKALVQKTNLWHLFEKGGLIMWPLLFASILSLGVASERIIFLMVQRMQRDPKGMDEFFKAVGAGDMNRAVMIGSKSKFFVVRAMDYALRHKEQSLASALLYAQALELKKFQRGIPILDTIITLAPLMGLLGTITGMMGSFSVMGGEMGAATAITGGIAEALIATAFGLIIAMTSLIPFNILNTKLEQARAEMEAASTQLELLVHPGARKEEPATAAAPGALTPIVAG